MLFSLYISTISEKKILLMDASKISEEIILLNYKQPAGKFTLNLNLLFNNPTYITYTLPAETQHTK